MFRKAAGEDLTLAMEDAVSLGTRREEEWILPTWPAASFGSRWPNTASFLMKQLKDSIKSISDREV